MTIIQILIIRMWDSFALIPNIMIEQWVYKCGEKSTVYSNTIHYNFFFPLLFYFFGEQRIFFLNKADIFSVYYGPICLYPNTCLILVRCFNLLHLKKKKKKNLLNFLFGLWKECLSLCRKAMIKKRESVMMMLWMKIDKGFLFTVKGF